MSVELQNKEIDALVNEFGEDNRELITDAIVWVYSRLPVWRVDDFDVHVFVESLIESKGTVA